MTARPLPPPPVRPSAPVPKPPRKKRRKTDIVTTQVSAAVLRAYAVYIRYRDASVQDVWEQAQMAEDDPAAGFVKDHVSLRWLQKCATDGKWVAERDKFWDGVQDRIREHVQDDVVQRELAEIRSLASIREEAWNHLFGSGEGADRVPAVKPKSWEQTARVFIKLDERIEVKRDRVQAAAIKASTSGNVPAGATDAETAKAIAGPVYEDTLSPEEAIKVARGIAAGRVAAGNPEDE